MQTQLPEGLRALMQASQILQQASSPVVQTPAGPKPTVAGMVSQGLQQVAQEKALPQIGQQAGIAGQIQAQRMAQQQQMAQDPQAIAQMAAQMMQRPEDSGIAALPVDMQFKDGGIVGYNGEEDSYVDSAEVEKFEDRQAVNQIKNILKSSGEGAVAAMKDLYPPKLFMQAFQELGEAGSRAARAIGLDIPKYTAPSAIPNIEAFFKKQYGPRGTTMRGEKIQIPEDLDLSTPTAATVGARGEQPARLASPSDMTLEQMYPPGIFAGKEAQIARMAPSAPAAPPTPSAAPIVADTTGIKVPSAGSVMETTKGMLPDITQSGFFEQIKKNAEEREKWLSQQPNLEQEGIKLIQQSAREREALLQGSKQNDNYRRFMAAMNTVRYGSNDYVNLMDRFEQRDEAARKAALAEQDAIQKFKQAEQARLAGKFDRADALAKTGLELFKDAQKNQVSLFGNLANMETNIYSSQMTAATAKATEASRAADRAEQRRVTEEQAKATQLGRLRTLIQDIDTEIAKEERKFAERPDVQMARMNEAALKKNPDQYQSYLNAVKDLKDRLEPMRQQRKAYLDQLKGTGWGELTISEK